MIIKYSDEFNKSIKKLTDKIAIKRLLELVGKLENAKSLDEISNVEPVTNNPSIFRIRTGDFRLIVKYVSGSIEILLVEYLRRNEKTYKKYK
ncbi:MAG: hypothetical protein LBU83_12935 [Bacteroidales bacterium]|jgi:mRNA-degrading endonuclease RelE of RelBE toxin-antitoxin system|nr:hypothetical protein [Bacteroidales bacterium]